MKNNFKIKKGINYWIISCLLGSVIYSIVFTITTYPEPAFAPKFIDYIIFAIIFFILSLLCSIPIPYFINKTIKSSIKRKLKIVWCNLILFAELLIVFIISSWLMKNIYDGMGLVLSYGIIGYTLTNQYLIKEKNNFY